MGKIWTDSKGVRRMTGGREATALDESLFGKLKKDLATPAKEKPVAKPIKKKVTTPKPKVIPNRESNYDKNLKELKRSKNVGQNLIAEGLGSLFD